jgi:hypothetical protein
MSQDIEKKVIERFVVKTKRDRYLTLIERGNTRGKFISELAHFRDLRQERFEEISGDAKKVIRDRIKGLGIIKDCDLISENTELGRKRLDIDTALSKIIGHGMGLSSYLETRKWYSTRQKSQIVDG